MTITNLRYSEPKTKVGICHQLPLDERITMRLLSDPTSPDAGDSWFVYREVNAWLGLVGGHQMPGSVKQFPLIDGQDPYWARVAVSPEELAKGRTRAASSQKVITSVIFESGRISKNEQYMPEPGTTILLKLSKIWFERICEKIAEKRMELGDDWSPIGPNKVWLVRTSGSFRDGFSIELVVREDGLPMDLPEPLDGRGWVLRKREQAVEFIDSLDFGSPKAVQAQEAQIVDDFIDNRMEAKPSGDALPVSLDDDIAWAELSNGRIKQALDAARIAYSPRATRPELIELAKQHL